MQVVDRVQARAQDLVRAVQMVQVSAREILAAIAGAALVQRRHVFFIARILDLDVAKAREQPAVAGVPGRHHAVEHVDAVGHAIDQVFRRAHAHQVVRLVLGQARADVGQDALHVFFWLTDRQAANGQAREVDVFQAGERLVAQVLVHAALDDAEQRVRVLARVKFVHRALGPAQRHAHRFRRFFGGGRTAVDLVRRAFVELHHDVRVQRALDLHRDFGRQEQLRAVDRRRELDALFRDLAHRAERKHLEAARVGQDRTVPAHELVQAAELVHHVHARAQPQVEGVAQDDLRADVTQFDRVHRLDRAVRAHWHEDRGFDGAVVELQAAAAGVRQAAGVFFKQGKFEHCVL